MSFYDFLLRDKRWIKKRKFILKRDKYQCTVCGNKNNLCVHHTFYYKPEVAPWCYPNDSLLTLCKPCHYNHHIHSEIEIKKLPKKHKKKRKKKSLR